MLNTFMEFDKEAFIALVMAEPERLLTENELTETLLQGVSFYRELHRLTLGHEAEAVETVEALHKAGEITRSVHDSITLALFAKDW